MGKKRQITTFIHPVRITVEEIEHRPEDCRVRLIAQDGRTGIVQCVTEREKLFVIRLMEQINKLPPLKDAPMYGAPPGVYFGDIPMRLNWEELNILFPDLEEKT